MVPISGFQHSLRESWRAFRKQLTGTEQENTLAHLVGVLFDVLSTLLTCACTNAFQLAHTVWLCEVLAVSCGQRLENHDLV